jgi:hypothetical protein
VEGGTEERRCGCVGWAEELVVAGLGMSGGHSPMKGSGSALGEGVRVGSR